jgi:GH24 family phage-related lysozyme (muramidase)
MTSLSKSNVVGDKLTTVMNAHHKKFMAIGLSLIGMGLIHQASLLPQNQTSHVRTWNAEEPADSVNLSDSFNAFSFITTANASASANTNSPSAPGKPNIHKVVFHNYFHSKLEAFVHVLGVSEGKSHTFYQDNKGIAIGYGWNPTRNSKEFNLMIAQAMHLDNHQQKMIASISDNEQVQYVPKGLKNLVLSDSQIRSSANIFLQIYEQEFLKVLKIKADEHKENFSNLETNYHKLPYNQQAVLIHMTYKLGVNRLQNYQNFFNNLVPYMKNPSEKGLYKVSDDFEYNYKTRKGDWKHDNRTEQTHQVFFSQCSDESNQINVSKNFYNCSDYIRKNTVVLNAGQTILSVKVHDKDNKNHLHYEPVMTKEHGHSVKSIQMASAEKKIHQIRHEAQNSKMASQDNKSKKLLSS